MGIIDGFMGIVGFTVDMALILKSMKERADISKGIIFTFKPSTGCKVFIMVNIGRF